ncbi:cytochrome P450 [Nonomuraea sp. 3-1Str]|uniref:cytochrome P450 n=1 Tax=Nonomuraea sp. 3-1Str TaxID=2929801 RepID=UPI002862B33E|nr:cytochrome P450 [Nonomuraea sp. 3-1Str]MDR8411409.1 cytochrome P450 [Nonomuraea sp. 3-1Str]
MSNTYYRDRPVTPSLDRSPACPFDPAPSLTALRAEQPIARLAAPGGAPGVWMITGYDLVRQILADPRFSSRYETHYHPLAGGHLPPAPVGDLTGMDAPRHTRFRKLLAGKFTVRRMNLLTERVTEITRERLDAMERQGPPADLVEVFAQPVPALMICELLGVPYGDRDRFRSSTRALSDAGTAEAQYAAFAELGTYLRELALAKRAEPTDDLLSDLATGGDLSDEELGGRQLTAGDTVIIAINAANRDPARFSDPDVLDLRRSAAGHLAFGHGVHQCLGQQLARIEMRVAFPALLTRFPTLRLAVPAEDVSLRTDPSQVYGVHSLPVTWDRG